MTKRSRDLYCNEEALKPFKMYPIGSMNMTAEQWKACTRIRMEDTNLHFDSRGIPHWLFTMRFSSGESRLMYRAFIGDTFTDANRRLADEINDAIRDSMSISLYKKAKPSEKPEKPEESEESEDEEWKTTTSEDSSSSSSD